MDHPGPGPLLEVGLQITLALLAVAACLGTYRVFVGPSLPDRVISLDLVGFSTVAMIGAYGIATGQGTLLDVALVLSLLMFLGTVAFARYFEQRARSEQS